MLSVEQTAWCLSKYLRQTKYFDISTDLVLENGVPKAFCNFTHSACISVILLVACNTRLVGEGLQLVVDILKSPEMN